MTNQPNANMNTASVATETVGKSAGGTRQREKETEVMEVRDRE